MKQKLSTLIESIYDEYTPLNEIDRQLLNRNHEDNFKKLVDEKCHQLSEIEKKRIDSELFGWGPLVSLIDREDLFEIILQGPHKIHYEDSSGMKNLGDVFLCQRSFNQFIDRMIKRAGLLINQSQPFANGTLDGFRLHMVIPPIVDTPTLTLRKHRNLNLTWNNLLEQGFLNHSQSEILHQLIQNRANMIIVGPTGSGKTTFLNTLLSLVSPLERVICLEDTDELSREHPFLCKLLTREFCPDTLKRIDLTELLKQSLRMRPDRIVVGEVRGGEAKDLLQALSTGHSGSWGTLHAESGRQALLRLEMLIQMGAPQWNLHSIRQLIQMSLDYIVVLKGDRMSKGIQEISRIRSVESFGLLLEEVKEMESLRVG